MAKHKTNAKHHANKQSDNMEHTRMLARSALVKDLAHSMGLTKKAGLTAEEKKARETTDNAAKIRRESEKKQLLSTVLAEFVKEDRAAFDRAEKLREKNSSNPFYTAPEAIIKFLRACSFEDGMENDELYGMQCILQGIADGMALREKIEDAARNDFGRLLVQVAEGKDVRQDSAYRLLMARKGGKAAQLVERATS